MGSSSKAPSVPNPANLYRKSLAANIAGAPQIAGAELNLRDQYDTGHVEQNLDRQQQQGGNFLDLYRSTLAQGNPGGQALQKQLGGLLSSDLTKGYTLDPEQIRAVEQEVRAQQIGTGNFLGNAAASQEASAVGKASFAMHQKRISAAETYLAADKTLEEYTGAAGLVTKVTNPDRSASYVQPQAGNSFSDLANQTYQEDVQFAQYYTANINQFLGPWQRMAQGAYIGLREGWQGRSYVSVVAGAWGALGGALGGSFQGLINAPDYQFNVDNSGYAIYGVPWQSTAISTGTAVAAGVAGAYGSQIGSIAINAGGNAWADSYRNAGGG